MNTFTTRKKILLATLLILGVLIRIPEILRPFWSDELISVNTLSVNPLTNPFYTGITTNLPLYFWCLSLLNWIFNPADLRFLRIFGIVTNLLTACILWRYLDKNNYKTASWIFLFMFLFAPLQVHYSSELRPYVLSQLIAALLFIASVHDMRCKKNVAILSFLAVLGLLTHYSLYIFFFSIILFLLVKYKNLKLMLELNFIPVLVTLIIAGIYFGNPLFRASLSGLELKRGSVSPIYRIVSFDSINRLKEVVTNYYYYGLYYYRQDIWAQFVFKKVFFFFLC